MLPAFSNCPKTDILRVDIISMGKSELRHFCRHCRGKLLAPAANHREAFDSPGCHKSFYRHRCIACEREMPRNTEHQRVCYRAECKTAWRLKTVQSRFLGTGSTPVSNPLKTSIKSSLPEPDKYGRRWRIVAGSLTPNQFHCATVPDGPGCQWEGGSFERIEAKNRAALKSHIATLRAAEEAEIEANGYFSEPDWRDAVSPDGVRCFVTRISEVT